MIKRINNALREYATRWLVGTGVAYTGTTGALLAARAGYQTTSGVAINEDSALTIPAFFHALRTFGQVLGSLEWELVQWKDKGDKEVLRNHPVYRLLHDEPNDYQLPSSFRETIIFHAISYGNGYAYIERNGNMRPTALYPLLPDRTMPIRIKGELKYRTYVNGRIVDLEPFQVFHIAGISNNGLSGIPLVKLMSDSLGLTKAEEQWAQMFFGSGINTGGFIESPQKLSDKAKTNIRQSVNEEFGGLYNAFKWMFLEEGLKINRNEINAEQYQLVPARQFQLGDIARIVGLAPHLLYDLSRSTNNNIEQQGIEAVTYSYKPFANKLCQEVYRKLLYESEKGSISAQLDLKPLMMGDSKTQAERDQIRFNCAAMTPNEIRAQDGRNRIDGGDELFVNMNTIPLKVLVAKSLAGIVAANPDSSVATTNVDAVTEVVANEIQKALGEGIDKEPADANTASEPTGNETYNDGPKVDPNIVEDANTIGIPASSVDEIDGRAFVPIISDSLKRLHRRDAKAIEKALNKDNFTSWFETYRTETRKTVVQSLTPVAESLNAIKVTFDVEQFATDYLASLERDIAGLNSSKDKATDFELMVEGWKQSKIETEIGTILGENNE